MRIRLALAIGLLTAAVLLAVGAYAAARPSTVDAPGGGPATKPVSATDRLDASIADAQERLKTVPGNYNIWAALGSAYVERARISGDPSFYPKADGALRRSLEIRPQDNAAALTGLGALANARHDFAAARDFANRAIAANSFSAEAYGVLADAQTQLGQPEAATAAVQKMLDLRPSLAALTRASYDLEQHGKITEAIDLMTKALQSSTAPADLVFCRLQLGQLAFHAGNLDEADRQFGAGLQVDATSLELRAGRARVAAARGQFDAALTDLAEITRRSPMPSSFLDYALVLRAAGRDDQAKAQLDLADAAQQLFAANGGSDDLAGAELALARGDAATAVTLAEREWQRRQFSDVADVLGWALHSAGRSAEALPYAQKAGALGARNATYAYHQGMIELALGDRVAARASLSRALEINPKFSPLDAPLAARALAGLGTS